MAAPGRVVTMADITHDADALKEVFAKAAAIAAAPWWGGAAMSTTPQDYRSDPSLDYRFFLYCPIEGYKYWKTEQERDKAAETLISEYLREGEWSEEVTLIRAGIVTDTHCVVEVDRVDKVGNLDEDGYDENGVYWSSNDYDCRCNYVLRPLPATQDP